MSSSFLIYNEEICSWAAVYTWINLLLLIKTVEWVLSPTRYNRYVSVQFQFIQNQIFIFVIACGEKYSLWTYDFELEICPEGIMYHVSKYSSSLFSNRRFSWIISYTRFTRSGVLYINEFKIELLEVKH